MRPNRSQTDRSEQLANVRRLIEKIDQLMAEGNLEATKELSRQLQEAIKALPVPRSGIRRIIR